MNEDDNQADLPFHTSGSTEPSGVIPALTSCFCRMHSINGTSFPSSCSTIWGRELEKEFTPYEYTQTISEQTLGTMVFNTPSGTTTVKELSPHPSQSLIHSSPQALFLPFPPPYLPFSPHSPFPLTSLSYIRQSPLGISCQCFTSRGPYVPERCFHKDNIFPKRNSGPNF